METKEQLIGHIRRWIEVDNRIADLQQQIKQCREEKKNMSGTLVEVMKNNEIDCFDINDGKLLYSKSRVKKPLSKKALLTSLSNYFGEDNNEMASDVGQFILENREETVKESIRRK